MKLVEQLDTSQWSPLFLSMYYTDRYGEQAGRVSDDGLVAAGNTVDLVSVSCDVLIIHYLLIFRHIGVGRHGE